MPSNSSSSAASPVTTSSPATRRPANPTDDASAHSSPGTAWQRSGAAFAAPQHLFQGPKISSSPSPSPHNPHHPVRSFFAVIIPPSPTPRSSPPDDHNRSGSISPAQQRDPLPPSFFFPAAPDPPMLR